MGINKKGVFITFEGGEGSGKSTQVKLLEKQLKDDGYLVRVTREPGGVDVAEEIRNVLKNFTTMDPISEVMLMFEARREHYVKLIQTLLEKNYVVISDRFYDSSIIYQGILKNVSVRQIMFLKKMVLDDFEPDITFVLDISAEIAKQRVKNRESMLLNFDLGSDQKNANDGLPNYDQMSEMEYEIIRNGFKKIASVFDFRSVVINATGNPQKVFQKIYKEVRKRI